jgi:hypothetical protein
MNKILLVVIVILGLLMGGYFLLPQEKLNELSQYLPAPLSTLLGIGTTEAISDQEKNEVANGSQSGAISINNNLESTPEVISDAIQVVVIKLPSAQKLTSVTQKDQKIAVKTKATTGLVSQKVIEAKSLADNSPEVLKIKKRLVKVQNRINEFDETNTTLKARFDKIVQKNRALAQELKKINDQIKDAQ